MNQNEIMVSVCCAAYNHEKYIRKCLDGFVMQRTNFRFEIIVHDDASTDRTAEIIREYEERYPELIRPIYQTENQYSQKKSISLECVLPNAKGKYIALCEGDDFWTDPEKLQKQFDALEAHPDCHLALHRVIGVSEDAAYNMDRFPPFDIESGVLDSRRFLSLVCGNYYFQTSSYFFRTEQFRAYGENIPAFKRVVRVGDVPYLLYFGQLGNIYYINDAMSCYRRNSIGSWTMRNDRSADGINARADSFVRMLEEYDKYTDGRYHDLCVQGIRSYEFSRLMQLGRYKELLRGENRELLRARGRKFGIRIRLYAISPRLGDLVFRLYNRLRREKRADADGQQ